MKVQARKILMCCMALVIIVVFSGCGKTVNSDLKDELIVGLGTEPSTLDMHQALGTHTASIVLNIFDSLTRVDNTDNQVKPLLAESYKALDETTWEFKLHKGVKFHNGEAFNAQVVKYNVERLLSDGYKSPLAGDYRIIQTVEVVDDYTVNIITKQPFPSLPLRLSYLGMVPPKYAQEVGEDKFARNPVGTGPYKFVEWNQGNSVALESNESYFKGAPSIKKVTYRFIPEDNTRLIALETGEIDIATSVPPNEIERVNAKDGIKIVSGPSSRTMFIGLNSLQEGSPMANQKVRQAMSYAVNVQEIIDSILMKQGKVTSALVLPEWFGFSSDITSYPYDPEKAKQLLSEAGYPNGFETTFAVVPGKFPAIREVAQAISGQLEKVGIRAELKTMENGLFTSLLAEKKIDPMYINGLGGPYAEAAQTVRIIVGTGERYSNYSNPELDTLIREASQTMESERAKQLWKDVQSRIKEDAPVISLYQQYGIYGVSDKIKNWKPRVDEVLLINEISLN